MAIRQNIGTGTQVVFAGDTIRLAFAVTTDGTTPKNLTGAAVSWAFSPLNAATGSAGGAAIVTKTVGSGITLTDATGGLLLVKLEPADTASVAGGDYYHELQITDAASDKLTAAFGVLRLSGDLITS